MSEFYQQTEFPSKLLQILFINKIELLDCHIGLVIYSKPNLATASLADGVDSFDVLNLDGPLFEIFVYIIEVIQIAIVFKLIRCPHRITAMYTQGAEQRHVAAGIEFLMYIRNAHSWIFKYWFGDQNIRKGLSWDESSLENPIIYLKECLGPIVVSHIVSR